MKFLTILTAILLVATACKKEEVEPAVTQAPILGATIGLTKVPAASDPICTITPYTAMDFDINAIPVGTSVNDFTLYNASGTAFNLASILAQSKPILLVSGSYTCPVFRSNVDSINQIVATYSGQLSTYIIYGVEAHPAVDPSPYSGEEWQVSNNISEGIVYRQPTTYGERLSLVNTLTADMTINCEILVDGPCNEWWEAYGEAPNRAYLIDTKGKVYASHGWFSYTTMISNIDALLAQ